MNWTFNQTFLHIRLHVDYWEINIEKNRSRFLIRKNIGKINKNTKSSENKMDHLNKPLFGSQLVNSSSKTPYSDATQVKRRQGYSFCVSILFLSLPSSSFVVALCPQFQKDFIFACATYWERKKKREREIDKDEKKCLYTKKKVFLEFFSTLKFYFSNSNGKAYQQLITHTNTFETSLNLFQYNFFFHFHLLMYSLSLTNNIIWVTQGREKESLNDIYIYYSHTHGHTYTHTVWYIMRCRANVCVLLWLLNVQMFNILCF